MSRFKLDYFKLAVHIGALTPLVWLLVDWRLDQLTFNPIQEITKRTGRDALVLLLLALSCAPLSQVLKWRRILTVRRALGVYAFVYALFHFATFVWLDYMFDLALIAEGILEKPFALVGFLAFLILLPLAITSTNGWIKRLGKNWKRLHRFIYPAAVLVIIHFTWAAKQNFGEPLIYGGVLALLLLWRVVRKLSK